MNKLNPSHCLHLFDSSYPSSLSQTVETLHQRSHLVLPVVYELDVLYYCFKLIYLYLNEGDKVWECYDCLKMVTEVH